MDELNAETGTLVEVEIATPSSTEVIVTLSGELDMSNIEQVDATVAPLLAGTPQHLIVDASALAFADSSAIALWLRWASSVDRFELREPSALLRRVLSAMGLAERLGIDR